MRNHEGPNRVLLVVAGLVVVCLGLVGIVVFPHDEAVTFPIPGWVIGSFLVVMGLLITSVHLLATRRRRPPR